MSNQTKLEPSRLYARALEAWGAEAQLRMLQEECAELTVAVAHFFARPNAGPGHAS